MNSAEEPILNTIIYSDLFKFPLRIPELHRFLISPSPISKEHLEESLGKLCSQGLVEEKNGFCFLPGRNFIQERLSREEITKGKIRSVKNIVKLISYFPSVKMVGLTGDLSYGNGRRDSDVDLMIVTSIGRMWLTRLLTFFLLRILGRKMNGEKNSSVTKICVNVWCDENNLFIPENEQDVVLASDIVHLVPLINKENTYEKFISGNIWLKKYFSNWN